MSFSSIPFDIQENNLEISPEKLKIENKNLRAQLKAITREKKIFEDQHNKEKEIWQQNLRQLQERLVLERNFFQNNVTDLNQQLNLLKKSVDKFLQSRKELKNSLNFEYDEE